MLFESAEVSCTIASRMLPRRGLGEALRDQSSGRLLLLQRRQVVGHVLDALLNELFVVLVDILEQGSPGGHFGRAVRGRCRVRTGGRSRCSLDGNLPPWRFVRVVKSGGMVLSVEAAGPLPLASRPWQAAQYCAYIKSPDGINGARVTVCGGLACPTTSEAKVRTNELTVKSALRIDSCPFR